MLGRTHIISLWLGRKTYLNRFVQWQLDYGSLRGQNDISIDNLKKNGYARPTVRGVTQRPLVHGFSLDAES